MKHAVARQTATPQIAAIEPDGYLYGSADQSTGLEDSVSKCGSSDPAAEILMVDSRRSPPGFPRGENGGSGGDRAHDNDGYIPQPLTSEQRAELCRRNGDALFTPIAGDSPEALAL